MRMVVRERGIDLGDGPIFPGLKWKSTLVWLADHMCPARNMCDDHVCLLLTQVHNQIVQITQRAHSGSTEEIGPGYICADVLGAEYQIKCST